MQLTRSIAYHPRLNQLKSPRSWPSNCATNRRFTTKNTIPPSAKRITVEVAAYQTVSLRRSERHCHHRLIQYRPLATQTRRLSRCESTGMENHRQSYVASAPPG